MVFSFSTCPLIHGIAKKTQQKPKQQYTQTAATLGKAVQSPGPNPIVCLGLGHPLWEEIEMREPSIIWITLLVGLATGLIFYSIHVTNANWIVLVAAMSGVFFTYAHEMMFEDLQKRKEEKPAWLGK